jgi:hypothetical protein
MPILLRLWKGTCCALDLVPLYCSTHLHFFQIALPPVNTISMISTSKKKKIGSFSQREQGAKKIVTIPSWIVDLGNF